MDFLFPGFRLARTEEDLCDACVKIEVELSDPNISDERRAEQQGLKKTHLSAAIDQRRAMRQAILNLVLKEDDAQRLAP